MDRGESGGYPGRRRRRRRTSTAVAAAGERGADRWRRQDRRELDGGRGGMYRSALGPLLVGLWLWARPARKWLVTVVQIKKQRNSRI
jgi:hypothetical protein